jgi:biotin operon repressor
MQNYYHIKTVSRGWTKLPNAIRHDKNLTSDAKVIIEELLSVSGDFHISENSIASSVNLSLERVKKAIRLLKNTGYIQIIRLKDGTRFVGCQWGISDTGGTFHQVENPTCGNQATENQATEMAINPTGNSIRLETERMETARLKPARLENLPIYQSINEYQQTNYQRTEDKRPTDNELIYQEREGQSGSPSPSPLNLSAESVISSGEVNTIQAFNRFCEVYPNLGDRTAAQNAFMAVPDIDKICWQIVNSVEWFEKRQKWDNWQTGQKNVSCPQAAKFLTRGDWQEYLKSGATVSTTDRILAILAKENGNEAHG